MNIIQFNHNFSGETVHNHILCRGCHAPGFCYPKPFKQVLLAANSHEFARIFKSIRVNSCNTALHAVRRKCSRLKNSADLRPIFGTVWPPALRCGGAAQRPVPSKLYVLGRFPLARSGINRYGKYNRVQNQPGVSVWLLLRCVMQECKFTDSLTVRRQT